VEPLSFLEPPDYGGIEAENYRDTRERTRRIEIDLVQTTK
jgi:hypothetical protein